MSNRGDARADISFQFRFHTSIRNPDTFLYNTGPIASATDPNWNRPQTYSVTKVTNGVSALLGTRLLTPPVDVGPHSVGTTTDYHNLVSHSVHTLANNKRTVFPGQRARPFFGAPGAVSHLLRAGPPGARTSVG